LNRPVPDAVRRRPGRPRDAGAEARLIDAAIEEYAEHGRAGFSINGVARRAGVAKSALYLRWEDLDALLADAIDVRTRSIEAVDTGTLRGDLEGLAENLLRHYLDPVGWATLRIAVDAAGSAVPPAGFAEKVTDTHRSAARDVAVRAVKSGDVGPDAPLDLLVEAPSR
jgi:AcrR family transcriptional regulator